MSDFIFTLKVFVSSVLIVLLMQIKIGPMSIEERTYLFLQSSLVTGELQRVADGGVRVYRKVEEKVSGFYRRNFASAEGRQKAKEKVRDLKWRLRRDEVRAKAAAEEAAIDDYSPVDEEAVDTP